MFACMVLGAAALLACGDAGGSTRESDISAPTPTASTPATPGASAAGAAQATAVGTTALSPMALAAGTATAATGAPSTAATAAAPTPAATGGDALVMRTLGAVTFADRGTVSAAGKSELAVAASDFVFTPTFVQGTPGQKGTLRITNDSSTTHNLSVAAQQVDRDIAAKSTAAVAVTIPQSGVLLFFCKFHTGSGMNGELLAGTTAPAGVEAPAAAPVSGDGY